MREMDPNALSWASHWTTSARTPGTDDEVRAVYLARARIALNEAKEAVAQLEILVASQEREMVRAHRGGP